MKTPHEDPPAKAKVKWSARPADKAFEAARNYLTLLVGPLAAEVLAQKLRDGNEGEWKAKHILRAANLPALTPKDSPEVGRKVERIKNGGSFPPVLLVVLNPRPLVIADGYRRVCAAHYLDEDADVTAWLA